MTRDAVCGAPLGGDLVTVSDLCDRGLRPVRGSHASPSQRGQVIEDLDFTGHGTQVSDLQNVIGVSPFLLHGLGWS